MSFHLPIPSWNTLRRLGIVINTLSFLRRSLPTFPPLLTISSAAASQRRSSLFSASDLGLGAILLRVLGCLARGTHGFASLEHGFASASTAYKLVASADAVLSWMPSPEDGFSVAPQSL